MNNTPDISSIRAAREQIENHLWPEQSAEVLDSNYNTILFALSFYERCLQEIPLNVRMDMMAAWDKHAKARKGNISWPEMMDVVGREMIAAIQKEVAGE